MTAPTMASMAVLAFRVIDHAGRKKGQEDLRVEIHDKHTWTRNTDFPVTLNPDPKIFKPNVPGRTRSEVRRKCDRRER